MSFHVLGRFSICYFMDLNSKKKERKEDKIGQGTDTTRITFLADHQKILLKYFLCTREKN